MSGQRWSKEQHEKFSATMAAKRAARGRKAAGAGKSGRVARSVMGIPLLDGPPVLAPESDLEVSVHAGSAITFTLRGVRVTVRAIA